MAVGESCQHVFVSEKGRPSVVYLLVMLVDAVDITCCVLVLAKVLKIVVVEFIVA